MAKVPVFDFRVMSDSGRPAARKKVRSPGQRWVETVWEFVTWTRPGNELGTVTIVANWTNPAGFQATFELDGYDLIEVTGVVPGKGSWKGKGTGRAIGVGRTKDVRFEFRNPKGWG